MASDDPGAGVQWGMAASNLHGHRGYMPRDVADAGSVAATRIERQEVWTHRLAATRATLQLQRLAAGSFLAVAACNLTARGSAETGNGSPLPAKWEYSLDGGKTFSAEAPTITAKRSPDEQQDSVVARATFEVPDPAQFGLLNLRVGANDGGFALTDADSVDRYNVGTKPNLLKMKLSLNGKETDAGLAPYTLYRQVPIDPVLLTKGPNTIRVSGVFWFQLAEPMAAPLRLETLPANVVDLERPPVLGAVTDDSFTLAARSVIPAVFAVTTKPLDPAGADVQQKFGRTRQWKGRVSLPKGTRKFQYSVTVSAGGTSKTHGPCEVRVPTAGVGFRFVAAGNTAVYQGNSDRLKSVLTKILEVRPDLFIHTGKYVDCTPWDSMWTERFFGVYPETLARIPLFPACGLREMESPESFKRQFYFPPDDQDFGCWTTAVGNVRFVAVESWSMSQDKTGNSVKWLDQVLSQAKESFLVVINPQVSHCSTPNAGRAVRPVVEYTARSIDPLLVKHKVTVTIGGHHTQYERAEPPPTDGVSTIMTCFAGGSGKPLQQVYVDQNKDSRATYRGDHYVLFEVKKDKLVMQACDLDGKVFDTRDYAPR